MAQNVGTVWRRVRATLAKWRGLGRQLRVYKRLAPELKSPSILVGRLANNYTMKIGCLLIAGSLFAAATVRADEVIEDVMKHGFKGKESIAAKIG